MANTPEIDLKLPSTADNIAEQINIDTVNNLTKIDNAIKNDRQQINDLDSNKANTTHSHTKLQITDFPTSLPADGGNADTVDSKHIVVVAEASKGTDANTIYFCY